MVRTVADRAFLPAKGLLEEVGDMMILTGKTIMSALRPPYPYGGEFVSQFLFALKLCWFPLVVSTVAFGYGAPGLQAANFLQHALRRQEGTIGDASDQLCSPCRRRRRLCHGLYEAQTRTVSGTCAWTGNPVVRSPAP